MFTISKMFHFSAAHQLVGLPDTHPCSRLHGHNYTVEMVLEAYDLDATGFVQDYNQLSPVKAWIDQNLDHRNLNDVFPGMQTSAENIAKAIYDKFSGAYPKLSAVSVCETDKTWAVYSHD